MKNGLRSVFFLSFMTISLILWRIGAFGYISFSKIDEMKALIQDFGIMAPIVFMLIYVVATIFFLPDVPITVLGGVFFGPVMALLWVSIGSTAGAVLAFLIGRYMGKGYVSERFSDSDTYRKLQDGVNKHGWKALAITRLIPLFPFNIQNYVYGLTDIPLRTYTFVSWLCMLPAISAYVFLAGTIVDGNVDNNSKVLIAFAATLMLLLLSAVGKRLRPRFASTK